MSYTDKPRRSPGAQPVPLTRAPASAPAPGKQTLVQQLAAPAAPPRATDAAAGRSDEATTHAAAAQGVATPASPLPFRDAIQRAFGHHDVSSIQAHSGPEAAASAQAMGAEAYATGDHVVLDPSADLHTVAHEAAHVVQQRGGVHLKGGVGAAGDPHERHADAVADRVVAKQSAEALLDRAPASGARSATPAIQRKEGKDDAKLLAHQASLHGPDVEIPALEGALLATRKQAVERGLLSQASFDAGLALSRAMTQLQPAVAAKATVDPLLQHQAALAARQLFLALQKETAHDRHFKPLPSMVPTTGITAQNPYTGEVRATTVFLIWANTHDLGSRLEDLPALLLQGSWPDAFRSYRRLLDGLDLWVADQLRTSGKGTDDEARGNAHQYRAQLRSGLEQIADKHARRLPALFHPDPDTVAREQAAGRPAADTIPMNVYVWKDDKTGTFRLRDLTTPGRPHEHTLDGPPTAAALNTFFEEVARYPEGEVRYTLPDGAAGVAPTTGKTRWYEWIGYAGLALAGLGLALLTGGASLPATVCFAAGALAGGASAAGHLADSTRLGTATTATIVLDVAQIAASLASFGALSITIRAGGAAAALAGSRWFVPLVGTAAATDAVQLVALTDLTYFELTRIQNGPGSPEDKQRAMAVLLTQLAVMGGLTALSVQGARNARALAGQPLELVDQNGVRVLRVTGEASPTPREPQTPRDAPDLAEASGTGTPSRDLDARTATHEGAGSGEGATAANERWLAELEGHLTAEEKAKLAKMKRGKSPEQTREMLGGDLPAAHERVRSELRAEQARAAMAASSKARVADLRRQIVDRDLMNDPDIRAIVDDAAPLVRAEQLPVLRDKLVAKILRTEIEREHPAAEVVSGVKVYERLAEANIDEWASKNPGKKKDGLTPRVDGLYLQRGEIDMMVLEQQPSQRATIVLREEVKTGFRDTNADARGQLDQVTAALRDAAAGKKHIRLEVDGRDIAPGIDLASDAAAGKSTRGPAGKGFDKSLGVSASDLEALCRDLLDHSATARSSAP